VGRVGEQSQRSGPDAAQDLRHHVTGRQEQNDPKRAGVPLGKLYSMARTTFATAFSSVPFPSR
jgi:hypothetical protein